MDIHEELTNHGRMFGEPWLAVRHLDVADLSVNPETIGEPLTGAETALEAAHDAKRSLRRPQRHHLWGPWLTNVWAPPVLLLACLSPEPTDLLQNRNIISRDGSVVFGAYTEKEVTTTSISDANLLKDLLR